MNALKKKNKRHQTAITRKMTEVIKTNGTFITINKTIKSVEKPVFAIIHVIGDCPDFGYSNKEWDGLTDWEDGKAYFYNKSSFSLSSDVLDFTAHNKWRSRKNHFKIEFPQNMIRKFEKECWDVKKIKINK
jgi:hypothetical protein